MNAVISLCHFCEFHGPKIIYCTQPFRPQESNSNDGDDHSEASIPHRPKSASVNPSSSSITTDVHGSSSSAKDHCEGCKSTHRGFVSHDSEARVSYVSSQQPHQPEVFTRIRQACIRSLSVESCPGRIGPIFFGDKQYGYVLSYTFSIPDNQARGMQRSFSIVVVMMDKIYLLNSWPFLVPHLKLVIENLEMKAQKIYSEEEARCPQRPYRLGARLDASNFIKQRGGNKPARSLQELTGDKNVFCMLHVAFLWILKACGNRISETLLEGPPTEDTIIDMEKQEETEEGFIKIFTRKLDVNDDTGSELVNAATKSNPSTTDEEVSDRPKIKNLRHLKKLLGSSNFRMLAHHVVLGNQVIVSGEESSLVASLLHTLRSLLPKGCCRVTPYSEVYEESFKCNFLGLSPDVGLPDHVTSSEIYILVTITKRESNFSSCGSLTDPDPEASLSSLSSLTDAHDDLSCQFCFRVSSPVALPGKVPTVLEKMMMALENENLGLEVVHTALTCLKEEWMNKVKVLFKFTKAGGNRSEEDTKKLLQVVGAREEDKQLLKFWMTGLSVQYRTHILSSSAHR